MLVRDLRHGVLTFRAPWPEQGPLEQDATVCWEQKGTRAEAGLFICILIVITYAFMLVLGSCTV